MSGDPWVLVALLLLWWYRSTQPSTPVLQTSHMQNPPLHIPPCVRVVMSYHVMGPAGRDCSRQFAAVRPPNTAGREGERERGGGGDVEYNVEKVREKGQRKGIDEDPLHCTS